MRRILVGLALAPSIMVVFGAGEAAASSNSGTTGVSGVSGNSGVALNPGGVNSPGGGIPGWFIAIAVLAVLIGIVVVAWRVSLARQLAKDAGISPNKATAVALMDSPGLDATYLAANLRSKPQTVQASVAQRLKDLADLKEQGLITAEEYANRRQAIIDSV